MADDEKPKMIDVVRAAVAEAQRATEEMRAERKVIDLRTREPHRAPEPVPEPVATDEPKVDTSAVQCLRKALEKAEKGEVWGVVILTGVGDEEGINFVAQDISESALEADQVFIGACHTVANSIMAIVEDEMFGDDAP